MHTALTSNSATLGRVRYEQVSRKASLLLKSKQQINNLEEALEQRNQNIAELEAETKELVKSLKKSSNNVQETLKIQKAKLAELGLANDNLQAEKRELEKQIEQLKSRQPSSDGDTDEIKLKLELDSKVAKITALEAQIVALESEIKSKRKDNFNAFKVLRDRIKALREGNEQL